MNKKNVLIMVVAMVLVAVVSVGGTMAWLAAGTDPVTNTFSVGDINIKLDETNLDNPNERTEEGNEGYKIVPGVDIAKDPKVTVLSGSEKCYVFVSVTNNLVLTIDGVETVVGTPNIDTTKWMAVGQTGKETVYVYIENEAPAIVDALSGNVELPVFTKVVVDGEKITKTNIGDLDDKTIVLEAYAHQSDTAGYDTAKDAALAAFAVAEIVSGN